MGLAEPMPDPEQMTRFASEEHDVWVARRTRAGWHHAKTFNYERREHPHLTRWDALPLAEQSADRLLAQRLVEIVRNGGLQLAPLGRRLPMARREPDEGEHGPRSRQVKRV